MKVICPLNCPDFTQQREVAHREGGVCLWAAHGAPKSGVLQESGWDIGIGELISFNPAIPRVEICPKENVRGVEKIYVQQALFKIAENCKNT